MSIPAEKGILNRDLALMYVGTVCGTAMWLSSHIAFVQSRPNDIDLNHMAPERFFAFIPFFAFWALGIGALVEILGFVPRFRPLRGRFAWIALGLAYSLVWVFYAIPVRSPWMLVASYLLAFIAAGLVHLGFASGGTRRHSS